MPVDLRLPVSFRTICLLETCLAMLTLRNYRNFPLFQGTNWTPRRRLTWSERAAVPRTTSILISWPSAGARTTRARSTGARRARTTTGTRATLANISRSEGTRTKLCPDRQLSPMAAGGHLPAVFGTRTGQRKISRILTNCENLVNQVFMY